MGITWFQTEETTTPKVTIYNLSPEILEWTLEELRPDKLYDAIKDRGAEVAYGDVEVDMSLEEQIVLNDLKAAGALPFLAEKARKATASLKKEQGEESEETQSEQREKSKEDKEMGCRQFLQLASKAGLAAAAYPASLRGFQKNNHPTIIGGQGQCAQTIFPSQVTFQSVPPTLPWPFALSAPRFRTFCPPN